MPVRPRHLALMLPLLLGALMLPGAGQAGEPKKVTIGILNDQNGPFADQSGKGSVAAAQLAVEEFPKEDPFIEVDLTYEDHQNKPGLARQIVGAWLDRGDVDVVADVSWSRLVGQFGGMAKLGSGCRQAANFSIPVAP